MPWLLPAVPTRRGAGLVLCSLPDTGERHLNTPLFAKVAVDMSEEERDISRSIATAQLEA
jgi:hypothetical protein